MYKCGSDNIVMGTRGEISVENVKGYYIIEEKDTTEETNERIDSIIGFVEAYEKLKYKVMRDGGPLPSVNCFMLDYCEKLRAEKK